MTGYLDIIIPKQLTNLVTNPSIETGTTGFTTGGTNTIARSSEQAHRGIYSLKSTYADNDLLASYAVTLTAVAHTFSVDIYIPSTYTGTQITAKFVGFTSATGTTSLNADMTKTNQWQRLSLTATPDSGDLSGTLEVQETGTNGTGSIYTDGWQCVAYDGTLTYIDGDREGARWIATPHASKSISNGYEPSLGYYLNLYDNLDFTDVDRTGFGLPPINNLSSPLALQPGSLHDDQTIAERMLTLQGSMIATSPSDWHSKRQTLLKALNSRNTPINEKSLPRVFRVTSPTVHKEFRAVYDSGLEGGMPIEWADTKINLGLLANDPLFYATGEKSAILDTHDSGTFTGIAARIDGVWSNLGPPNASGTYDTVRDVLIHNGKIYVTGTFSNWDNIANADNIAMYDIDTGTWAAMGTGLDALGRVLLADAAGNIYVGGEFATAGGVTCRGVAMWDGSSWNALGPPSAGDGVWALAIDPTTGYLYVGGDFENWDGDAAGDRIVYWDGSAWNVLDTGISTASSTVRALAFDEDGLLYIGGDFESPESRIMTWDGSAFALVGDGLGISTQSVNALIFYEGQLYAGGTFTGTHGNYLSIWNGQAWVALPQQVNANVIDFAVDQYGDLYASGYFTLAGDVVCEALALWNGSRWSRADIDFASSTLPFCIDTDPVSGLVVIGTDNGSYTAGKAGATTINYSGTYNAYPVFSITRDGGTFADLLSLRNHTTGAIIYMVYTLLDGETLTIDFRPGKQEVISSVYGSIPHAVFANSDIGQFYLMPGNESGTNANKITCFVQTTGGDPSLVVASLRWRDAYISED